MRYLTFHNELTCVRITNKSKGDPIMNYSVLLIAAGKQAAKGESYQKALAQFKESRSVIDQTVSVFMKDPQCKQIVLVTNSADMIKLVQSASSGKIVVVKGGKTRQESVFTGLSAVSQDTVLIHDGVRPWLSQELIDRLLVRMETEKACILSIAPPTAIYEVVDGYIKQAVNTSHLAIAQTPQAFNTSFIFQCYRKALQESIYLNDDASIVRAVSEEPIAVEQGDIRNARFIV